MTRIRLKKNHSKHTVIAIKTSNTEIRLNQNKSTYMDCIIGALNT